MSRAPTRSSAAPARYRPTGEPRHGGFRTWPRPLRWSAYVAVVLMLGLVAGLFTVSWLYQRPLPQTSGEATLPGLDAEVTVIRDANGIPQIYADTTADLMRAQGYVAAQDRFFEMDVRRHATAGRLAELFGEDALPSDMMVRTMDGRGVAEEELALISPDTREALEAYAEGVNAYLGQHDPGEIAVQYTLLGLTGVDGAPEEWTPVDSLAWLKAMAWDLRGNMDDEIQRVLTESAVGPRRAADLWPAYPYDEHQPIVSQGAVVDGVFEQDATRGGTRNPARAAPSEQVVQSLRRVQASLDAMPAWLGRGDGLGSNSWVVSGEHTSTGAPLLANDPHLGTSLPGVWLQVGLHCRVVSEDCPLDVAGFSFSGVPGVMVGHNADIAWGFTNLDPDVTDLYLEQIRGDRWRHGGRWRPLQIRSERIEVHDAPDVTITVRRTGHGPVLSDVDPQLGEVGDQEGGYAVSLAWTALEPSPTADAILAMNTATDWDSFRAAAADFAAPAQNLVYADREGHIGYQAPGALPVRKSGNDGTRPSEGWLPENDWLSEPVPFDGLPNVLDPEEGFVVTANQAVIDPDRYPYHLTDDWDRGYRSQRIRDELSAMLAEGPVSIDDMSGLQLDDRAPIADHLVPLLLDVPLPDGYWSDGQDVLADWDEQMGADSAGAAYYNSVWRHLLRLAFHDELPVGLWPDGEDRWIAVVERLLDRPADLWWDDLTTDGVIEDRDEILAEAMRAARDEMTRLTGRDPEDWEWGRLHRMDLTEQTLGTSGITAVERLLNRGGWQVAGGTSAVDATGWLASAGYDVITAPSMRMVVSLDDLDDSRWINLTGVSGHPASEHYTDQTELWARGDTLPWAFTPDAVDRAGRDTLTLTPGG
ncbi:penicillin acylase family protein [Nocardioides insulae]|uniref:penicillin acylase family protein n=1 Tax=Nocardioides insulae TaxID=394734 RepID=UPI0012FC61DF|nr:penicillin acylase family protein [Nocardioides insulae]